VHAWSEAVAAEIIGPTCAIHYVDGLHTTPGPHENLQPLGLVVKS
jgi:hypothetical protein